MVGGSGVPHAHAVVTSQVQLLVHTSPGAHPGPLDLARDPGRLRGREAGLARVPGAAELADAALRVDALAVDRVTHAGEAGTAGVAQGAAALVILYWNADRGITRLCVARRWAT